MCNRVSLQEFLKKAFNVLLPEILGSFCGLLKGPYKAGTIGNMLPYKEVQSKKGSA